MDCMLKMKQIYTQLTAKERLVADYIQAFPNQAVSLSVQELAIRSQSSTASVMRMVKKLGYDSFPIFKIELAKSGEPKEPPRDFIIKCKDSLPLISEKIHHATENAWSIRWISASCPPRWKNCCPPRWKNCGMRNGFFFWAPAVPAFQPQTSIKSWSGSTGR